MRCEDCNKKIFHEQDSIWAAWHSLAVTISLLESEGSISEKTSMYMLENLLRLKFLVSEYSDQQDDPQEESKDDLPSL